MIAVPDDFAQMYLAREGESGRTWIDTLPALVDELAEAWGLTVDETVLTGHVGLVCLVERDGQELALKVSYPYEDNVHEGDVLAGWNGDGAVRLLEQDRRHKALLMERAGPESLVTQPVDESIVIIAELWSRIHRHDPFEGAVLTNDAAREWVTKIPDEWAFLADDLQSDEVVLLHGDLHYENVLRADREPWLAIDPKCYAGDRTFEAVSPLWDRLDEITGDRDEGIRARHLQICEAAGFDVVRAAKWSILHALEDGDEHGIVPALTEVI